MLAVVDSDVDNARATAADLGKDETHAAFAEQLFHFLVQQPLRAYGPETRDTLRHSFEANQFNMRRLAVEIMTISALVGRNDKMERVGQAPSAPAEGRN